MERYMCVKQIKKIKSACHRARLGAVPFFSRSPPSFWVQNEITHAKQFLTTHHDQFSQITFSVGKILDKGMMKVGKYSDQQFCWTSCQICPLIMNMLACISVFQFLNLPPLCKEQADRNDLHPTKGFQCHIYYKIHFRAPTVKVKVTTGVKSFEMSYFGMLSRTTTCFTTTDSHQTLFSSLSVLLFMRLCIRSCNYRTMII